MVYNVFFFFFFFHMGDVEILAKFASKIAKLVKITLGILFFQNFPDFHVKNFFFCSNEKHLPLVYIYIYMFAPLL